MKMTDKPLLSFVLPVYNVEDYLEECVESIRRQITEECEVILVDDGAKDRSGEICDRYALQDERILVIHKQNGGLSSARNAGLEAARGEYVTFVDSDDRIAPQSVESILEWIRSGGADLCFLEGVKFYPDGTETGLGEQIDGKELAGKEKTDAVRHLATRPKYPGSAWAKLYRRDFLQSNQLHFPYDRRYSEDLGFMRDCILCAESFDALSIPYYEYRQNRPGSITNSVSGRNFMDLMLFVRESAEKLCVNEKAKDEICRYAMGFTAYEYSILMYLYSGLPQQDKAPALEALCKYRWVLGYSMNLKGRVTAFACRLLGIRITSALLKAYRKVAMG